MGNERGTDSAHFLLCSVIHIAFFLAPVCAIDPLEGGFIVLNCIKERPMTGCPNETLLSAYNKTEWSKSDKNINKAETRFFLFTPCNKKEAEFLHECGGRLPDNTNFRPHERTVIIIHGYLSGVCAVSIFREIVQQFLCRKEYLNVILVSWSWGDGPDYYGARRNTEVVAKQTAFLIKNIIEQKGAQIENFYIVGHSLGAHIAGCTGEYVQALGLGKLGRVTGLDTAAPGYKDSKRCCLSQDDAEQVDVMHSNAGDCLPFALGIPWNIGHADFYPNGGSFQLSCYVSIVEAFLKGDIYYAFFLLAGPFCPHFASVQYYKESINPCNCQYVGVECTHEKFKAGMCNSCGTDGSKCAVMGYDWDSCQPKFGNISYYLRTGIKCPTCKNDGIDFGGFSTTPPKCGNSTNCFDGKNNCHYHDC